MRREQKKQNKKRKRKRKKTQKKRGWHYKRTGMEENLGIFKVIKDGTIVLKRLYEKIKNNLKTNDVVRNSIKIHQCITTKENGESWGEVKEEAKAKAEEDKKDSNSKLLFK